jgi:hypothetical protein
MARVYFSIAAMLSPLYRASRPTKISTTKLLHPRRSAPAHHGLPIQQPQLVTFQFGKTGSQGTHYGDDAT